MRKTLSILLSAVVLTLGTVAANANENNIEQRAPKSVMNQQFSREQHRKQFEQRLNLTEKQKEKIDDKNIKIIKIEEKFEIGDLKIKPFSIPHDAANPCGFNIFKDNKKISIATDIGNMTNGIIKNLEDSIFILLESNYDPEVLKFCHYPYPLKVRIAGNMGHLSNETAGKTISHLMKSGLKQALLGHLSKESNFPELAYKTVVDEIISNQLDESSIKLGVASRDIPGNKIIL